LASRETFLVVNQPIPDPAGGRPKRRFLQVRGIEDPQLAAAVHNLELLPGGSWFSEAGSQETPDANPSASDVAPLVQAVLGEGVARELAREFGNRQSLAAKNQDGLEVGDTFMLGSHTWIVVGILKSAGSTFNSEIWAKRSLAAALFGKNTYTTLVLRTRDTTAAEEFKEFLSKEYKKAAVNAQVEIELQLAINARIIATGILLTLLMGLLGGLLPAWSAMRIKPLDALR
jgi:ABC-type lipoprotein release transport system permease subunit